MKWLVRFFLSLTLVFLSRYSQLHAHAHEGRVSYSLQTVFEKTAYGRAKTIEHPSFVFKSIAENTEKVSEKIPATDKEEEDDTLSSRKYLEISNCFTDFFYALNAGYFWRQIKQHAVYNTLFYRGATRTYLLFCVIRI